MSLQQKLNLDASPVYLMDGTAFIYRGFYTNQTMSRADGFPTNAIFMLARLLLRLMREERPSHFIFFMDGRGPNFRHELFPAYKANRDATPENLIRQLDPVKRMVKGLGLRLEVSEGCEADDCIASMAARLREHMPVVIVSGDKDLRQCLRPGVFMWDPALKDEKLLDAESFKSETGLSPEQWPDVQAIVGDTSDNIPGVPGIGIKTAEKIFLQYPNLEEIVAHVEELAPSVRKKMEPHLENIFIYRKLTTLSTDCCPGLDLNSIATTAVDLESITSFFREFELNSLVREIESMVRSGILQTSGRTEGKAEAKSGGSAANASAGDSRQLSLFNLAKPAHRTTEDPGRKFSTDAAMENPGEAAASGSEAARETKPVPVADLPPCSGQSAAVVKQDDGFLVAVGNAEYLCTDAAEDVAEFLRGASRVVTPDVKSLLEDNDCWQNIAVWFDLGLADYLLNPEEYDHSLARLAPRAGLTDSEDTDGPALLALKAAEILEKRLDNAKLDKLYAKMEIPLINVLRKMEKIGMRVDLRAFASFLDEVQKEIDRLTTEVFKLVGREFNMRSARQLGEILFDTLQLSPAGKTRGGQLSTSHDVLEKLAGKHVVVDLMLEYRKLEKLRSTYLEPLPKLADQNGRIHTTFNQAATATGRLSSSNPNLQNIPVRGEFGKRMRACFVAAPDHLLVSADYSQVELRVLAHISKEPALLEAFREGADIHARTAGLLFHCDLAEVTQDQRRMAKTINFGLIYGMGPQKLARELSITTNEAKDFIAEYFRQLSRLREFYDEVEEAALSDGFVTTLAGRKRFLPDIHSKNQQAKALARRQAINTVIQGSAADIIKLAMLAVDSDPDLAGLNARLLLQIHDELLLETPAENAEDAGIRVAELMADIAPGGMSMSVPLLVDWGTGENWEEAH